MFESSVNSEYSKTMLKVKIYTARFESSANSEYSKTEVVVFTMEESLRVV